MKALLVQITGLGGGYLLSAARFRLSWFRTSYCRRKGYEAWVSRGGYILCGDHTANCPVLNLALYFGGPSKSKREWLQEKLGNGVPATILARIPSLPSLDTCKPRNRCRPGPCPRSTIGTSY